jgi:hypothetical protein
MKSSSPTKTQPKSSQASLPQGNVIAFGCALRDPLAAKFIYIPIVILLLAALAWQGLLFIRASSQTTDEAMHIAAGYSYLKLHDFRLNPEHPPLVKELAAVPLLFLNLRFPAGKEWDAGDVVAVGAKFLYRQREMVQEQPGTNPSSVAHDEILFWARLPVLVLSLILGFSLFCWGRAMFGISAGLLALALYVLDPNIVAHSCLVTPDLGVTLFMFLSVYALWCYARKPHPLRIVWLGLAGGAAFASKLTAFWLVPGFGLLALFLIFSPLTLPVRPWLRASGTAVGRMRRTLAVLSLFGIATGIALLVVLATYFMIHGSAFIKGLAVGASHTRAGHTAFFMGAISNHGWWNYFVTAVAVKSPPGTLVLLALGVLLFMPFRWSRNPWARLGGSLFVIMPAAVIMIVAAFWGIDIGLRYVLPALPFLLLFAGSIAARGASEKWRQYSLHFVLLLCVAWNAVEAIKISPYDLAYFNPFIGGPEFGSEYLSDSNIDWGQSSKALKAYMDREGVSAIYCAFATNADPWEYGVRYQYVPSILALPDARQRGFKVPEGLPRELLAVSVVLKQGLYLSDRQAYDWLNFRTLVAKIGYAMLVYDITNDDMAHVRIAYGCYGYQQFDLAAHEARRALAINPGNEFAQRLVAALQASKPPQPAPPG